jgi:hypothetical protein
VSDNIHMSYFTDDSYEAFLARDEEIARYEEQRYQSMRKAEWWSPEATHCRDEHDLDEYEPVAMELSEVLRLAGCSVEEAAEVMRKPVQVERMQMSLFPEVA